MIDVDEGKLLFCCLNSKPRQAERPLATKDCGVGLTNVKRRLDLIYGDSYSLRTEDKETSYKVLLCLPIKNFPIVNNATRI